METYELRQWVKGMQRFVLILCIAVVGPMWLYMHFNGGNENEQTERLWVECVIVGENTKCGDVVSQYTYEKMWQAYCIKTEDGDEYCGPSI